jgi:hypothetical protein
MTFELGERFILDLGIVKPSFRGLKFPSRIIAVSSQEFYLCLVKEGWELSKYAGRFTGNAIIIKSSHKDIDLYLGAEVWWFKQKEISSCKMLF